MPHLHRNDSYSGAAELHVFVAERADVGQGREVLAYELAQYSVARSV